MASPEEILNILEEALKIEIKAEQNCQDIIDTAHANGYTEIIEKIKNDEHEHQVLVKELMEMIKPVE